MTTLIRKAALAMAFFGMSLPAMADKFLMASYPGIAPYIVQGEEGRSGIEIDVVTEAMAVMGHEVEFASLPFGRALPEFKNGRFDALLTISPGAGLDLGDAYFSDNHITFKNVAISLAERGLDIPDITSLGNYSVASFEFAKQYLGDEFAAMANANPNYREMIPDTRPLPPTLFAGRADVAVIEINIFKYHLQNETYTVPVDAETTVHSIFPENPFVMAFKDEAARDQFNQGLVKIRENGTYDAIFAKYVGE